MQRFMMSYRLPLMLLGLHTFLVLLLGFLNGSSLLHDQSPAMLLPVLLHLVDYPVHAILERFGEATMSAGYMTLVMLFGGVYWLAIGFVLRALVFTAKHDLAADA